MSLSEVIRLAKADVGYTECVGPGSGCPKHPRTPGCNHTVYGARFGLNGEPWCAVYAVDLWTRAGYGHLVPRTAGAWDMLARARAKGWALPPQMPRVGDVPVYALGDGHVGGVVTQLRAGGFVAVEGNTSRGNRGSQVNGWYVAERFRTVAQLRGLIRLPIDAAPQEDDMQLSELAGWDVSKLVGLPPGSLNFQTLIGRVYSATVLHPATPSDPAVLAEAIAKHLPAGVAVDPSALAEAVAAELAQRLQS